MNLIVCSEKCVYQQDGYCVLEHPRAIANPQGPSENRCIYLEALPDGVAPAGTPYPTPSGPYTGAGS